MARAVEDTETNVLDLYVNPVVERVDQCCNIISTGIVFVL